MAEFQWWLLLVGLVAGGGLVAVVTMDGRRREEDLGELERQAEATWIVDRLAGSAQWLDGPAVETVLRLHREYLGLPPPDAFIVEGEQVADDADLAEDADPGDIDIDDLELETSDRDADQAADEVRDDRGRSADQDLSHSREQQAPTGQEAHAGADREQRAER